MRSRTILIARRALLGLAAALIAIGLARQEYVEVLQKAVKICLECIGVG